MSRAENQEGRLEIADQARNDVLIPGTPLVSVLVPFYNSERYLPGALVQLAALDYPRLEFVFVDDGSTDSSASLVSEWALGRPTARLIRHETNRGIGAARNTLIGAARGEFVWFADADDKWRPYFVTELVSLCQQRDADVAIASFITTSDSGRLLRTKRYAGQVVCGAVIAPLIYREDVEGQLWNKLIRRSLFGDRPFPKLRLREDIVALVPALSRARRIVFSPTILYNYVRHGSSLVTRQGYDRDSLTAPVKALAQTFPQDWRNGYPTSYLTARFYLRSYLLQIVKQVLMRAISRW